MGAFAEADGHFKTRFQVIGTHETADAEFAHQSLNNVFDRIDIGSAFRVFTEHTSADLIRVFDALGHGRHDTRYLFHIINQV